MLRLVVFGFRCCIDVVAEDFVIFAVVSCTVGVVSVVVVLVPYQVAVVVVSAWRHPTCHCQLLFCIDGWSCQSRFLLHPMCHCQLLCCVDALPDSA